MNKLIVIAVLALSLTGCGKVGFEGGLNHAVGNWAEVRLPEGCKAKQIAADRYTAMVLCEDGRVFR